MLLHFDKKADLKVFICRCYSLIQKLQTHTHIRGYSRLLKSINLPQKIFSLAASGLLQGLLLQSFEMNERLRLFGRQHPGQGGNPTHKTTCTTERL